MESRAEHRRGKAGGGDLAQLGRDYREAKRNRTPAYLAAVQRGRAATARRKSEGVRSFGPKTREARERQSKLLGPAHLTQQEALLPALSLQVSHEGKQEGPASSFGLDTRVSQLKRDAMLAGRRRAEEKRQWQRYQEKQTEPLRAALSKSLGLNSSIVQGMHPVPTPDMVATELVLDHSTDAVTIAEWASRHSLRSNVKSSLLKDFENRSAALHDVGGFDEQARSKGEKLCLKYGLCICQEPGLSTFRLRNRMLQLLKDLAPRKHLALRIWTEGEVSGPSSWAALAREYEADGADEIVLESALCHERWLHIGAHYMTPYRPTFQELVCEGFVDPDTVCLQQTGQFYTDSKLPTCCIAPSGGRCPFSSRLTQTRSWPPSSPSNVPSGSSPATALFYGLCLIARLARDQARGGEEDPAGRVVRKACLSKQL